MPDTMTELTMTAKAKINLSLHVLGKRADGYHTIESVMQPLRFGDVVTARLNQTGQIILTTSDPSLPTDEGNLAYRAAQFLLQRYRPGQGVTVHIEKRIPIAAGLAGGSTDAAAVLHLVNHLLDLGLKTEELASLGVTLGADVPFCLYASAALAEGIGEKLTAVQGLCDCYVVLVNPGVPVSTARIYKELDTAAVLESPQTKALLAHLAEGHLTGAVKSMINVMQPVAATHCPAIEELLKKLKQAGALHSMMSGSGATCFGIFTEKPDAEKLSSLFGSMLVAVTTPA